MRRLALLILPVLAAALPAAAQVSPQEVRFCGGRLVLAQVETRPAMAGGVEYFANFRNTTTGALRFSLQVAADVRDRVMGAVAIPPGQLTLRIGTAPANSATPPLRGERLAGAVRVNCLD